MFKKIEALLIIINFRVKQFFCRLRDKQRGYNRLWDWFGLSHAGWITIPRVLMHSMPDLWQWQMSKLMEEWDDTWDFSTNGYNFDTQVQFKRNGKIISSPELLCNYRHPNLKEIENLKYSNKKNGERK